MPKQRLLGIGICNTMWMPGTGKSNTQRHKITVHVQKELH